MSFPLKIKAKIFTTWLKTKSCWLGTFIFYHWAVVKKKIMIRHIGWVIQTPFCDGAVSKYTVLCSSTAFPVIVRFSLISFYFLFTFFLLCPDFTVFWLEFNPLLTLNVYGNLGTCIMFCVLYCTCILTTLLFLSLSPVAYIYLCTVCFSPPSLVNM